MNPLITPELYLAHTPQLLSGWKAIAKYCGKSVPQMMRYRRDQGFPATRFGKRTVTSMALIDHWLMTREKIRRRERQAALARSLPPETA